MGSTMALLHSLYRIHVPLASQIMLTVARMIIKDESQQFRFEATGMQGWPFVIYTAAVDGLSSLISEGWVRNPWYDWHSVCISRISWTRVSICWPAQRVQVPNI